MGHGFPILLLFYFQTLLLKYLSRCPKSSENVSISRVLGWDRSGTGGWDRFKNRGPCPTRFVIIHKINMNLLLIMTTQQFCRRLDLSQKRFLFDTLSHKKMRLRHPLYRVHILIGIGLSPAALSAIMPCPHSPDLLPIRKILRHYKRNLLRIFWAWVFWKVGVR